MPDDVRERDINNLHKRDDKQDKKIDAVEDKLEKHLRDCAEGNVRIEADLKRMDVEMQKLAKNYKIQMWLTAALAIGVGSDHSQILKVLAIFIAG